MGLFFWKKNKKKTKLTEEEVDQLKEQLDEKMGDFRTIYHDLVEAGGSELPEDILESVSGGLVRIAVTTPPWYEKDGTPTCWAPESGKNAYDQTQSSKSDTDRPAGSS